jgi:glycosyltransferase involved in cell wall biosynthesis
MKRLLYVVHRYAPFPGGSENYVRDMAEESVKRGHEVWVFTGTHKGNNINGVNVTSDSSILGTPFDLIIVHGGDVGVQDFVLRQAQHIPSPILFMLILPSNSDLYKRASKNVAFVGCSTEEDWEWADVNCQGRGVQVRHGIDMKKAIGVDGFKKKFGIDTEYMFLSCGGYWQNKAMKELVDLFNQLGRTDVTMVTTGYSLDPSLIPQDSRYVKNLILDDRQDVLNALKEADLYVMHSFKEGFGLVLLEAMVNLTPWAARYNAGARLMRDYGFTYKEDQQLLQFMRDYRTPKNYDVLIPRKRYAMENHLISNTVDDIMRLIDDK